MILGLLAHPLVLFALSNLKRDLGKLWGWLCHRSFWQLMFGAALLLAGFEYIGKRAEQRHASKVETQLSKAIAGREADRRAYAKAQSDAAQLNQKQITHVKQEQQEITDATVSRLNSRLELIRGELRRQSSAAQGAAGSAAAGDPGATSGGTACPACMLITPEERLRGAQDEERHQELIDWVVKQSQVNPNAAPPSTAERQQAPPPSHHS